MSPFSNPDSGAKPPFTTDTNAWAPLPCVPVFVKTILSPISKSKPPSSTIISVRGPAPSDDTLNNAPWPPPVKAIVEVVSYKAPSLVIILEPGIPVTVDLINVSFISDSVPCIVSPISKLPLILSSFMTNSDTLKELKEYLKTFSTIAVASDVSPVIVRPTNFEVSPVTSIALNIFLVPHSPSDAFNKLSLGYLVSDVSLNNNLKKIYKMARKLEKQ